VLNASGCCQCAKWLAPSMSEKRRGGNQRGELANVLLLDGLVVISIDTSVFAVTFESCSGLKSGCVFHIWLSAAMNDFQSGLGFSFCNRLRSARSTP